MYFTLGRSPDSRAKFWGGSLSPKMLEAKQGDFTFAVRKIPNLLLKSAKNCDSQCYQSADLTFFIQVYLEQLEAGSVSKLVGR